MIVYGLVRVEEGLSKSFLDAFIVGVLTLVLQNFVVSQAGFKLHRKLLLHVGRDLLAVGTVPVTDCKKVTVSEAGNVGLRQKCVLVFLARVIRRNSSFRGEREFRYAVYDFWAYTYHFLLKTALSLRALYALAYHVPFLCNTLGLNLGTLHGVVLLGWNAIVGQRKGPELSFQVRVNHVSRRTLIQVAILLIEFR